MQLAEQRSYKTFSTTLSSAERTAEKTSWTLAATLPTDPQYQPCERHKTLPVKPPNLKSDSRMRSLTAEPIEKQRRKSTPPTTAELLPNRLIKPSVWDIISFRTSMPDMTIAELGQVADLTFGWQQRTTITSGDYVRGVTAGYDFARKENVGKIKRAPAKC